MSGSCDIQLIPVVEDKEEYTTKWVVLSTLLNNCNGKVINFAA
jgi:hypothetical protein